MLSVTADNLARRDELLARAMRRLRNAMRHQRRWWTVWLSATTLLVCVGVESLPGAYSGGDICGSGHFCWLMQQYFCSGKYWVHRQVPHGPPEVSLLPASKSAFRLVPLTIDLAPPLPKASGRQAVNVSALLHARGARRAAVQGTSPCLAVQAGRIA